MQDQVSESLDGLLEKAALRQAQIRRLKKTGSEEGSNKAFPAPPTAEELRPAGTSSNHVKENVSHHVSTVHDFSLQANNSTASSDPDSRPPEHMKKVFASLADAYRSVDEEDSHGDPVSGSRPRGVPRTSKQRSPLKATRSSSSKSSSSPNNREKREHETSATVSPRPSSKVMRPENQLTVSSPSKKIEPTELSLQERKAIFEKASVPLSAESLSVQDKKAFFEKSPLVALSPKKKAVSPMKQQTDSQTLRRAIFQEAANKAQDPSQAKKPARLFENVHFQMKSPKKIPEKSSSSSLVAVIEPPKEVGNFTKTLQDKLLVQTQAWKSNDLSRKIEEQKEEDMKVLKKRWELMAEEERRAASRQAEIEEILEKRKINGAPPSIERPPPLPLPGSSALHETTLKANASQLLEPFPPPPPHLLSPVFDAIARFENPSENKMKKNTPPPPPPLPLHRTNIDILAVNFTSVGPTSTAPIPRRQKLPEEEGVSTASESSDDHQNDGRTNALAFRQKRSVGPRSHTNGRVVSWSSDGSDEESNHNTRSPQQKRTSSSKTKTAESELSYIYEHELNDSDGQSEGSSLGSSTVTQPISLSFYRKAQKESGSGVVKRIVVHEERRNDEGTEDESRRKHLLNFYQQKIDALHGISSQQQAIQVQTTSALNLCRAAPEFQGSIERAECERLLLLAAKKRDACHNEINRLKTMIVQLKQGTSIPDQGCHGTITISSIVLPTKEGFVDFVLSEAEYMHYFVMLIKHREKVHVTQMVNSVQHLQKDGTFVLPNAVTFEDLENDFLISIEVYAVQARRETVSHEEKYHIKDSNKKKGQTLKKLLPALKDGSASHMTMGTPSKQEIRATSFGCVGFCLISLQNVHEGSFKLSKVPEHCALDDTLQMKITCGVSLDSTEEGFLTIFEDACGPSAWHRRWCVLKNDSILMWKYPEDMETHRPTVLNLRTCRGQVELASVSVCARPNTFQMTLTKPLKLAGVESKESGPYRYLVSADGKDERFMWQEKLNKVLSHIRAWIPNQKTVEAQQRR